jgi:glycine/D-amino acid oxidase-like deaminating enzyme
MTRSRNGKLSEWKDLHDGRTLWEDAPRRSVRTRQLRGDETFEIAIVGAGISGALAALVLSAAGHEVVVVDRRAPGEGSTLASTAMIQFEIDTPLIRLSEKIGHERARRAYRRSTDAVTALKKLIDTHGLVASWVDRDALYLAGDTLGFRAMKEEVEARRAIGLPSEFLSREAVKERFGIEATGAILSSGAAELNPVATSAECLRAARRLGTTIISPCEITGIESAARYVRLTTSDGATITAKKAIMTMGYEVIGGLPRDAFTMVSSWAIATKPIPPETFWPGRCLVWEAADPYLYMRTTRDNRILAGGEDSGLIDPERRAAAVSAKAATLLRKVRKLLHRNDIELDYAWGGAFADSPTGLPLLRPLDDHPNVFAVLGCGGNGITFSMVAAELVSFWVKGRRDPDADLFRG